MGYGKACQARRRGRGAVAVDCNASHTALHPLSRPPPARVSARAPLLSADTEQTPPTEVKGILSARKKLLNPLCLRQITGKGIVGSRRWMVGGVGGCVCRWMPSLALDGGGCLFPLPLFRTVPAVLPGHPRHHPSYNRRRLSAPQHTITKWLPPASPPARPPISTTQVRF